MFKRYTASEEYVTRWLALGDVIRKFPTDTVTDITTYIQPDAVTYEMACDYISARIKALSRIEQILLGFTDDV